MGGPGRAVAGQHRASGNPMRRTVSRCASRAEQLAFGFAWLVLPGTWLRSSHDGSARNTVTRPRIHRWRAMAAARACLALHTTNNARPPSGTGLHRGAARPSAQASTRRRQSRKLTGTVRAAGGWRQAGLLGKLAGKAEAWENLGSAEGCDGGDAGAPQRQHVEGDREVAALLRVEFVGAERQLPICPSWDVPQACRGSAGHEPRLR